MVICCVFICCMHRWLENKITHLPPQLVSSAPFGPEAGQLKRQAATSLFQSRTWTNLLRQNSTGYCTSGLLPGPFCCSLWRGRLRAWAFLLFAVEGEATGLGLFAVRCGGGGCGPGGHMVIMQFPTNIREGEEFLSKWAVTYISSVLSWPIGQQVFIKCPESASHGILFSNFLISVASESREWISRAYPLKCNLKGKMNYRSSILIGKLADLSASTFPEEVFCLGPRYCHLNCFTLKRLLDFWSQTCNNVGLLNLLNKIKYCISHFLEMKRCISSRKTTALWK